MHVYGRSAWAEGFLDETPRSDHVRLRVHRQLALVPAAEQYFVRTPDLAMVVSYLKMLGPRRVLRKVVSRRAEAVRNDAWVTAGLGISDDDGVFLFLLPSGPRGAERVLVHESLAFRQDDHVLAGCRAGHFLPDEQAGSAAMASLEPTVGAEVEDLAGWRPEETTTVGLTAEAQEALLALLIEDRPSAFTEVTAMPAASTVEERRDRPRATADESRPSFHCFGYGQYAKTQVIPNLSTRLELACIHEINPVQLGPVSGFEGVAVDTAARPRTDEVIENAVVAGYHHTHAPLAVELLDRGARHVIIEKPIATTMGQVDELVAAMERNPESRVHVAFQRRHTPFNALLAADLADAPISMAATVYEVPLPARHWYRWPVVGNAVVSNGCHWIDHFLFLNGFEPVTGLSAVRLSSQTALSIELANGASATISLRHEGAPRRGVRDSVTFWHDDATAVITDLRSYRAERGYRSVRRRSAHPYHALEAMYGEFARRIVLDEPGETTEALARSAITTLDLARLLDEGGSAR